MELNYYIGKAITQLPHILPLVEKLGGTIYTNDTVTYRWLTLHKPSLSFKLISSISEIAPCNIVLADYFRFPKTFNRIQIFHGFSMKSYINECPWEQYDVILNPSPHYALPVKSIEGFSRFNLYSKQRIADPKKCLYCPTHKLDNTRQLEQLMSKYEVIVKLHPNDYRYGNPIIDQIKALGVEVIDPMSKEYIEYEHLFNRVDIMASDFSSIAYEFTLTGKSIITTSGEIVTDHPQWFYGTNAADQIKRCLK